MLQLTGFVLSEKSSEWIRLISVCRPTQVLSSNRGNPRSGGMQRLAGVEQGLLGLTASLTLKLSIQGRSSGAASRTLALLQ